MDIKETLPAKIYSIKEFAEMDKKFNINIEDKWKFVIENKCTYSGYYGIYQDDGSNNYIVFHNNYDGTTEKLYNGKSERQALDVIWNLFLEEVYKSDDSLKMQIPKQFLNKSHPSNHRFYLRIAIIGIGCIIGFIILVKLMGFHNLIDYWINIK